MLPTDVQRFVTAVICEKTMQGHGATKTSGAALNQLPFAFSQGSNGQPLPTTKVILLRRELGGRWILYQ